ncbi:protein SPA, chloroplastic-like [Senna tora]|uniref:Protein SPA, chloroplastic-like n=1 Tax=Senna tora TaxID=362788 RepID=A0A834TYE0_9FABA|nr:protein SPA, chloroplastic-like [Senna tora]
MAIPLCLTTSLNTTSEPGIGIESRTNSKYIRVSSVFHATPTAKPFSLIAKGAPNNPNTKPNSVICADCDGNGAVQCSQCKGSGVNSVDIFNGQFKAGDSCWLCGGRKEMLCGNCNGAGFIGGFLSTYDQ